MRWRLLVRRRRAAAALLWMLPAAAVAALWVRSFYTWDEASLVDDDNVLRAAVSYRGALHLVRAEKNATPRALAWDAYAMPAGATWAQLYRMDDRDYAWMGFAKFSAPRPGPPPAAVAVLVAPPATNVAGAPGGAVWTQRVGVRLSLQTGMFQRRVAPWLFTEPYRAYAVPYWAPMILTAIPAGVVLTRTVRRFGRARRGLCAGCGYDLRATTGRCPECGEEFARRAD